MLDFNDAGPQRDFSDLIPAGTIVKVIGTIRPGGHSRPGHAEDAGYLTASKTSDALMLDWEFVVVGGPFNKRKVWQYMTVDGGKVDENGQSKAWAITRSTLRAMVNSGRGVHPEDTSPNALAARRFHSWGDLDGIEFVAKIGIEKAKEGSGYSDKNKLLVVIEPGHKHYDAVMHNGETILPTAGNSSGSAAKATWGSTPTPVPAGIAPNWATNPQPDPSVQQSPPKPAANGAGGVPTWAR